MKFSKSLKLNHVFRRLYHKGRSAAGKYLVIYCRKNGSQENRIGLTVSAKLGHAVVRNRIRRRLREIYRLHESQFQPGWDIVVVARGRAVDAPYQKLESAYLSLADKLGLLIREETEVVENAVSDTH
jgi:ribonuclease P protein component